MYSNSEMKQRVLLSGSDAVDLLHRISTVNLNTLEAGKRAPALILTPQGKIACFFTLIKRSPTQLEVEFEDRFLEVLEQYTFGERYQVELLPLREDSTASELERVLSMTPAWGFEFKNDDTTNPLEINLRTAIHDQKGCYPGQEVIEKIISLGSPARKLCLLEGQSTDSLPTPLLDATTGTEVGILTSYTQGHGLAIIRRTHLKEGIALKTLNGQFTLTKVPQ